MGMVPTEKATMEWRQEAAELRATKAAVDDKWASGKAKNTAQAQPSTGEKGPRRRAAGRRLRIPRPGRAMGRTTQPSP